jgi:hypothetical protein
MPVTSGEVPGRARPSPVSGGSCPHTTRSTSGKHIGGSRAFACAHTVTRVVFRGFRRSAWPGPPGEPLPGSKATIMLSGVATRSRL